MSKQPRETEQRAMQFINQAITNAQNLVFFGVPIEEVEQLSTQLAQALPNQQPNEFPDFYIPNGFVEHFQITSSRETSKGSRQQRESNQFRHKVDQEIAKLKNAWENDAESNYHEQSWMQAAPLHTHKNLLYSLEKNWRDHLQSFAKFAGNTTISIFLLDYTDRLLKMHQNVPPNLPDGCQWGDLPLPTSSCTYRLSRDKDALQWIYKNCNGIKYVLFTNHEIAECIKVENIPFITQWELHGYQIKGCIGGNFISASHRKCKKLAECDNTEFAGYPGIPFRITISGSHNPCAHLSLLNQSVDTEEKGE